MRLTTIMITVCFLQVSASTFGQLVTLNKKDVQLESVLKAVRAQSGYDFIYDGQIVPANKIINVSFKNAKIEEVMQSVLHGLQLTYSIEGKIVSIKKLEAPSILDQIISRFEKIDVRGRVIDSNGNPLSGASIRVKGDKVKVNTDDKGEFLLQNVDENAIIQITYIGYEDMEVKAGRNLGNLTLAILDSELEEVEIKFSTGYQKISRERSAGSFAKPDLDIMKNRSGTANILQRLDGLVPGLVVNNSPSASRNPFLVRGLSTIGLSDQYGNPIPGGPSRSPLIVVDGVPQDNVGSINTQDVEDITVLKDATAASIWGTRAANGVIVITTKKGKTGDKVRFEYDGFVNFQGKPDLNYIQRLNSRDFIKASNEVFQLSKDFYDAETAAQLAPLRPHQLIQYSDVLTDEQKARGLDSLASIDNRRQIKDLFYRNALLTNHTLSASGGGKAYSFYGSGSYTGTMTNEPGQKDDIYKINLRQDLTLNKSISLFLITDISNTRTSSPNDIQLSQSFVPYQLFKDANGNPLTINHMGDFGEAIRTDYQNRSGIDLNYNPLNERSYGYNSSDQMYSRIVGGGAVKILKNLRFEGNYGYNVFTENRIGFLDQRNYSVRREVLDFTVDGPDGPEYYLPEKGGRLTENNIYQKSYSLRNQLVFEEKLGKHQLTLLAGQEATSQFGRATQVIIRGWDDKLQTSLPIDYKTLNNGVDGTITGSGTFLDQNYTGGEPPVARTSSYYSNLAYSFMSKYTINGSWRNDQSNLFGTDKSAQNRPVWSIGGKWMLGAEKFMSNIGWLSTLDLRATYGVAGNAPQPGTAASYDILRAEASPTYVTGLGLVVGTPSNNKLTWETTVIKNAGFDFALFQGRFTGSVDMYIKNTSDLLGVLPVSPFSGYLSVNGNLGSIENKGLEMSLNSVNLVRDNFSWNTSFTLGYNKNKVKTLELLGNIVSASDLISQRYVAGYPAFSVFAYDYAGLNSEGDPQIRLADGTITTDPAAAMVQDAKFMGTTQPIWSGGLSNNLNYKGLSLNVNIVYNLGHVMSRDVNNFWSEPIYTNVHSEFANRWKESGDENKTNIPRYIPDNSSNNDRNTQYYTAANSNVFNASFIKLRDITLAYSIPKQLLSQLKVEGITFRAQLSNIMLWKSNKFGIDPEFLDAGIYGSTRALRVGQGTLTLGAHVNF